ncbi:ArsR/SmtB family transcription factor [Fictibacillus fluitans]|uniref:Winged helix-turn-helix domain-containing protein n=1 Tax=Fictibacillus fluitans TaxID=3058422 RepID=A0ABT8HUY2_9BACL|nr:winged helix-turn-helix domain-containing protein [Fictibacillus sp. NE201]MDN4524559.1 winged helix-turn-helix domain-containing protein [Fictibacillus sp. NE201]
MAQWKTQSIDLMKIFSDPRRLRILHLASEQPITVKQLAAELNEHPSRLYYHVKKLEDAELLAVAETKQLGNLVEKYYQTINMDDVLYRGDLQAQAEQPEVALSLTYRLIEPALKLYEKSLAKLREERKHGEELNEMPYHVTINSSSDRMTAKEWRESFPAIMKALGKNEKKDYEWPERSFTSEEEANKVGTYQYVLLSYRIEDAEELGVVTENEEEK